MAERSPPAARIFITGRVFVDSNILIYAHDMDAGAKQKRAADLLRDLWDSRAERLSTQVLQEFYVNVTQKIKAPLSRNAVREVVRTYPPWVRSWITPATVVPASGIGETWGLSFWDGMILAAAEQNQVTQVLSEDLARAGDCGCQDRESVSVVPVLRPPANAPNSPSESSTSLPSRCSRPGRSHTA